MKHPFSRICADFFRGLTPIFFRGHPRPNPRKSARTRFPGWIWLLPGLLSSCLDRVAVPIRDETPRLVVEGMITTERPPYTVKLSYSGKFEFSGPPAAQPILGAEVLILEEGGRQTRLSASGREPGQYVTVDTTFVGRAGRRYTLRIQLPDGSRYESRPEQMPSPVPIDSVYSEVELNSNSLRPPVFRFLISTKDPASEANFYRWTATAYGIRRAGGVVCPPFGTAFCYQNCWYAEYSSVFNLLSDRIVNGNTIRGVPVISNPVRWIGPQLVEVKQYSLTREAFQFWRRFEEQQSRTGSLFDPLPAPIVGNIVRIDKPEETALGYFSASALAIRRQRFEWPTTLPPAVVSYILTLPIPPGDCRLAYPSPGTYLLEDFPPGFSY